MCFFHQEFRCFPEHLDGFLQNNHFNKKVLSKASVLLQNPDSIIKTSLQNMVFSDLGGFRQVISNFKRLRTMLSPTYHPIPLPPCPHPSLPQTHFVCISAVFLVFPGIFQHFIGIFRQLGVFRSLVTAFYHRIYEKKVTNAYNRN